MEQLIEQMAFLRERGDTLSHEARRERAAGAAMEMARMFGEIGDDDDDEEECKEDGGGVAESGRLV